MTLWAPVLHRRSLGLYIWLGHQYYSVLLFMWMPSSPRSSSSRLLVAWISAYISSSLHKTISICTPIYSHFLYGRTSYQHLTGKLSPHLAFLGNWDRKRRKKKMRAWQQYRQQTLIHCTVSKPHSIISSLVKASTASRHNWPESWAAWTHWNLSPKKKKKTTGALSTQIALQLTTKRKKIKYFLFTIQKRKSVLAAHLTAQIFRKLL